MTPAKQKELLDTVDSIRLPCAARVVYVTDFETLKKGRDGEPLPPKLIGKRNIVSRVVNIAHKYTIAVLNQISKGGGDPANWSTDEHAWAEVDKAFPSGNVYQKKSDPEKKYIKIFEDMSVKGADGAVFDPQTGHLVDVSFEERCNFAKKDPRKAGSEKQADAEVAKQVKFRLVKDENIKYLRAGDREFSDLTPIEASALAALLGPKLGE